MHFCRGFCLDERDFHARPISRGLADAASPRPQRHSFRSLVNAELMCSNSSPLDSPLILTPIETSRSLQPYFARHAGCRNFSNHRNTRNPQSHSVGSEEVDGRGYLVVVGGRWLRDSGWECLKKRESTRFGSFKTWRYRALTWQS